MNEILKPSPMKGYRPCVGIALFARDGRVFLGKRATRGVVPKYSWQMPQGGVDEGEDPYQAACRELYEETSIKSVAPLGEIEGWLHYDLPKEVSGWRGKYRGQAQRWYALRFLGDEDEVNVLDLPEGCHVEFSRWKWAPLEEAPRLVVPFKRRVYDHVVAAFARYAVPDGPLRDLRPKAI